MSFENILADCLTLLDSGATEDECLARYPEYAEQLAPMLQIAARLRNQPAPRLSSQAFASGRAALRTEAERQQAVMAEHRHISPAPAAATQHRASVQRRWTMRTRARLQPRMPRFLSSFHLMTGVMVTVLLLMSGFTFMRSTGDSLPGDHIYGMKRLGENIEGALMSVAGQNAEWHMHQAERRLHESLALEMQGQTPNPLLMTSINTSVQSAINASTAMSPTDRTLFLALWLENLRSLQIVFSTTQTVIVPSDGSSQKIGPISAGSPNTTTASMPSIATLTQTIDTVETAAENHSDTKFLPLIANVDNNASTDDVINMADEPADAAPAAESLTDTPVITPTHTLTPTPTLTETPTLTPTPHPTATFTPTPHPTATPTWTVTASPTAAPTNTPTRSSSGGSDRATKTPRPTHTPTDRPTDTPTLTPTPEPTDTGEASPTPDPSGTAEQTPGPSTTPEQTSTPSTTPGTPGTPDPSTTPEQTPAPSTTPGTPDPSTTPGQTPAPSTTPDPSATSEQTPEPSATPIPEATATAVGAETSTPETPEPTEQVVTATPVPVTDPTEEPIDTPIPTADATEEPVNATSTPDPAIAPSTDTPVP